MFLGNPEGMASLSLKYPSCSWLLFFCSLPEGNSKHPLTNVKLLPVTEVDVGLFSPLWVTALLVSVLQFNYN